MGDIITQTKDFLVSAGIGAEGGLAVAADYDIYAGPVPATSDALIGIMRNPGAAPNPRWLLDFPSVQVRVRGNKEDYAGVHTKAQAIKDALLGIDSVTVGGDRWVSVTMPADMVDLGRDSMERPEFALNFNLIIEPATGTNRIAL